MDNASHGYHAIALDIKVELDDGCVMGTRMVKKTFIAVKVSHTLGVRLLD